MPRFLGRLYINFTYRELVAESLVGLAVALSECDSPVVALMVECIPRHVLHSTEATASIECFLELRLYTRPDLDAGAVAGVGHGYVVNVEILHDVYSTLVLAQ